MKKILILSLITIFINCNYVLAQEYFTKQYEDGTIISTSKEGVLVSKPNKGDFFIYAEPKYIINTTGLEVFQVMDEGAFCFTIDKGQIVFLMELESHSYYDRQVILLSKKEYCIVIGIHSYKNKYGETKTVPIIGIKD